MEYLKLILFFQFQDEDYFTWVDRQGIEHPLVPTNSSCDLKNPAWETNQGEVNDINQLPITKIKYRPLQFAKIKIVVGPIVCQPSENTLLIREQTFTNELKNVTENLKTKITENSKWIKNISPKEQCYDFPKIAFGYVVDTDSKYFYGDQARVECYTGKRFFVFLHLLTI